MTCLYILINFNLLVLVYIYNKQSTLLLVSKEIMCIHASLSVIIVTFYRCVTPTSVLKGKALEFILTIESV